MAYSDLIRQLKKDEEFRAKPYKDILGYETIGYGTKLPLTEHEKTLVLNENNLRESEACMLFIYRLEKAMRELNNKGSIIKTLSERRKEVICNMLYQLGVKGILNFKKMWRHLRVRIAPTRLTR
jgi:lysozyme